jgi:small multidrug resistance family-3 protein
MRIFLFVLAATVLEASGDAVIRISIHSHALSARILLFFLGSVLLTLYGTSLNLAPVEFASVTGIYVATLIVAFQIANYFFFHTVPTLGVIAGCALVVAGGLVIFFLG